MTGATITARLRYDWQDDLWQVRGLRPGNSHVVLMVWDVDGGSVDSGVPARLAEGVASALVQIGAVAFRWAGECTWPAADASVFRALDQGLARAVLRRMAGRVTGRWQSDVVLTRRASVAAAIFDHGWELQGQAALVLDGRQELVERVRVELATRRDWRDFVFTSEVVALLAPAVDGDGIFLAAGSEGGLRRLVGCLRGALTDAGIPFDEGEG